LPLSVTVIDVTPPAREGVGLRCIGTWW
jgi:hypothetical protein